MSAEAATPPDASLRPRRPLFLRLLAVLVLAGLVPLLGVALGTRELNRDALLVAMRERHLAVAGEGARALRGVVAAARDELATFGAVLLDEGPDDDDARVTQVTRQLEVSRLFTSVTVYGPDGTRRGSLVTGAAKSEAPPALDEPGRARAVRRGVSLDASTKADPTVLVPVQREGTVLAFLSGTLPRDRLVSAVREVCDRRLGATSSFALANASDDVLVASTPDGVTSAAGALRVVGGSAVASQALGIATEFTVADVPMLGAVETLPELGLTLAVASALELAYAPLGLLDQSLAWLVGVALLLALVLAVVAARSVSRPVRELVQATRDLARRRFARVESSVAGRSDELGVLGRAFERMARDLDASERRALDEAKYRAGLERYLPPVVAELVAREPDQLRLAGERREVTVLQANVVGFTRLTQAVPPEELVSLLNELFLLSTEIVQARGGMLDRFQGETLVAVWGTPTTRPQDPMEAVGAALELRRWIETCARRTHRRWGVELQFAFGVATGQAVVGNIGGEKRLEYAIVGEVVDTATRLQSLAAPGQVLVAEPTRVRLDRSVRVTPVELPSADLAAGPLFEANE